MKKLLLRIPGVEKLASLIKGRHTTFTTSGEYWINRYKQGGNSGGGSYNRLAEFKAEIINDFVAKHQINTVIELGSGDGNQLKLLKISSYKGFDISPDAISHCKAVFAADSGKQFFLTSELSGHTADLVMSLDVVYHLIEDDVYESYMQNLFAAATRFVMVYSVDQEDNGQYAAHVKPRKFTKWVEKNHPDFILLSHIPNRFPYKKSQWETTSFADFYIYERKS